MTTNIEDIMARDMRDAERKGDLPSYTDKEIRRMNVIEMTVLLVLAAAFLVFLAVMQFIQPKLERAAYLEGRYGLSHQVALSIAESEVR